MQHPARISAAWTGPAAVPLTLVLLLLLAAALVIPLPLPVPPHVTVMPLRLRQAGAAIVQRAPVVIPRANLL